MAFDTVPVARLATVRSAGAPGLVPIVFAYLDGVFWSPVDGKPKAGTQLARLRDVDADPRATLLLDGWDRDWQRLWWIRVQVRAEVVSAGREAGGAPDEFSAAAGALRAKYPQYRETELFVGAPTLLRFVPDRISSWLASAAAERLILEGGLDG